MLAQTIKVGIYRITIIVMLDGTVEILIEPPPTKLETNT
jgi:hypothetical protein